jgi:hypothetical protein
MLLPMMMPTLDIGADLTQAQRPRPVPTTRAVAPAPTQGRVLRQLGDAAQASDHRQAIALAQTLGAAAAATRSATLYEMARRFSLLGEQQQAYDCLSQAIAAGFRDRGRLLRDPAFARLRGQPAFAGLAQRLAPVIRPGPPRAGPTDRVLDPAL